KRKVFTVFVLFMLFLTVSVTAMEEKKESWNQLGINELTLFELAIIQGKIEKVKQFLAEGADPNFIDRGGCNPLHLSTASGDKDILNLFIQAGTNANVRDNRRWLPVMWAVSSSETDINFVKVILEKTQDLKPEDIAAIKEYHKLDKNNSNPEIQKFYRKTLAKLALLEQFLKKK
ncbi:MAG: ankyrin repeat domain-containing protein, partial [candidate division WWE3 bacterium]|nr:ankyrin repeat domain-containing protein [candidate division WWE3 bacterium]